MHKTSHDKMLRFKNNFLDKHDYLKILDIGSLDTSGNDYNYKSIFNEAKWSYEGLDFRKGENVDIIVDDIYDIREVNDNSYDVIISGQLFEHLGFFWLTMGEIDRILKPGGKFLHLDFGKKNFISKIFNIFVPTIAKIFSKNHDAYSYLIKSKTAFPEPEELINDFEKSGFNFVMRKDYIFGIISMQIMKK